MIRPGIVWGVARAEVRQTRRLVRYWLFVVLATLFGLLQYAQLFGIHKFFSAGSASAASTNPRYFVGSGFGQLFVLMFIIGLIFLGFDLRARDRKDRIFEVLDAKPFSNVELLAGRFLGTLIPTWIAAVVATGLVVLGSKLLGNSVHMLSVFGYLTFMALPAFTFGLGLVYVLALVLRNRLVAAVVGILIVIGVFIASSWFIPFWATPFTDVTGGGAFLLPSDVVPQLIGFGGLFQRIGYLLVGMSLIGFAVTIHPRLDDGSRAVRAGVSALLLLLGLGAIGVQLLGYRTTLSSRANWLAEHQKLEKSPRPDLLSMAGEVVIDPGDRIDMDLQLRFRNSEKAVLPTANFSLNPGIAVESVRTADGSDLSFTQENGILQIALASGLQPEAETTVQLVASGKPNPDFSYFDSVIEPLELRPVEANVIILGYRPSEFHDDYLALLPGVRWLPASGGEVGRGNPSIAPHDFYDLDLTVELPEGMTAAGPGRRQDAPDPAPAGRVRYRFAPPAPVPDVALVAGRFESRSMEIDGIQLELLLIPDHIATADYFADTAGEIRDWVGEKLDDAAANGLDYPYDALTMVEIPSSLRGYGGGWRMDSTLVQPSMILVRETSFPTAYFKQAEDRWERAASNEGGIPRAKRQTLERFFENDINGGNPFVAAARSFFGYQTSGQGAEGMPLDFVWENLSTELLSEKNAYFSVHFFSDQNFGQQFFLAGAEMGNEDRVGDSYSDVLIHQLTSTNKVWDKVTGVPLSELDPRDDPEEAINVLSLKGGAMAESMLDDLGREKTGALLATLRQNNLGQVYDRQDVVDAGREIEVELEEWLDLWIEQTGLPGFTLGNVDYFRLPDAEDGSMQLQLLATVRNEEPAPGMFRLEYFTEAAERNSFGNRVRERSEPIRLDGQSAVQVGLVVSSEIDSMRVAPYLALNRDPFNVQLPTLDAEDISDAEPVSGAQEAEWSVRDPQMIVVDDLDDGFSVVEKDGKSGLRMGGKGGDEDLDQGLPFSPFRQVKTSRWSRIHTPGAYGRYRRTAAVIKAGEGERSAQFMATVPRAGEWELEYYLPSRSGSGPGRRIRSKPGTLNLTISDASGSQEVTFDAETGAEGWNSVGTFEISDGEVRVVLTDVTDGEYVFADAIRWRPVTREVATLR